MKTSMIKGVGPKSHTRSFSRSRFTIPLLNPPPKNWGGKLRCYSSVVGCVL